MRFLILGFICWVWEGQCGDKSEIGIACWERSAGFSGEINRWAEEETCFLGEADLWVYLQLREYLYGRQTAYA